MKHLQTQQTTAGCDMIDYNEGFFTCRIRVNKRPVLTITQADLLHLQKLFIADFSVVYTSWFLGMIRRSWFYRHDSTERLPSSTVPYRNQSTQSESYFNDSLNVSPVIQKKKAVIYNLFSFSDNSLSNKSRNLLAIHVIGRVDVSINKFFGSFLNFFWASTLIFKEISYFALFQ